MMKNTESFEFKPAKTPFIYYPFLLTLFVSALIFIVIFFVFTVLDFQFLNFFSVLLFLTINTFHYLYLSVRYKKEKYFLRGSRIVRRGGSFFSDYETELVIQKITQVTMSLPFLEFLFFKTGSIGFKAAGSSGTEIAFLHIENPNDMYKKTIDVMEENGFNLTRDNLLQKENPSIIGMAVYTVFGFFNAALVMFLFFLDVSFHNLINFLPTWSWFLIIPVVLTTILLVLLYHFMKIKKTTYYLYEDMIEYTALFLNKHYSFIPIENLANCDIEQNFWQKILDLYNIRLSSQGSQNDILFSMIPNGTAMKKNISNLIEATPSLVQKKIEDEKKETVATDVLENTYTQDLKMNLLRTIVLDLIAAFLLLVVVFLVSLVVAIFLEQGLFVLLLAIPASMYAIPAFIFYLVYKFILVQFTTFRVNRESISEEFNFLSSRRREFTIEKTTSVIVKENIVDCWLNTVTLVFTSIGSGQNMTFAHISKDSEVVQNILLKNGFKKENVEKEFKSNFSFTEMFKGNFFFFIFLIPVLLISVVVSIFYPLLFLILLPVILFSVVLCFYKKRYYRYSKITFYNSYVCFRRGWLFKQMHYALYSNVKDLISTRYPFSTEGRLTFNIAGENFVKSGNNQNKELNLVSSGFTMNYISDVVELHGECDVFLHRYPFTSKSFVSKDPDFETNVDVFKPVLSNSVFTVTLLSIVVFPMILILPVTLAITVAVVRRISYTIQRERVVKDEGIFFKKKTSILYNRIDHIAKRESFVNKVFSNGSLTIYTVGSGMPELTISNVKNHNGVYEKFEEFYK